MKHFLFLSIFLLSTIGVFSQGKPITKGANYYKSKGYQVFEKYRLAVKVPCVLEDASNRVAANYDLHYGGFEQPFSTTSGAFYQIIVRKIPAGYNNLSIKEKEKMQDDIMLEGGRDIKIVYFQIAEKSIKSYLYEYQNNGIKAKSICFFYGNYIYTFNIISNDNLTWRFNSLTNNIIFY
jgi:hypothetical protein